MTAIGATAPLPIARANVRKRRFCDIQIEQGQRPLRDPRPAVQPPYDFTLSGREPIYVEVKIRANTMVDISADDAELERGRSGRAVVWRTLAVLLFLGVLSFAAADQLMLPRETLDPPDDQGRPFTSGVSALAGPDCLGGCLPNPLDRRALPREPIRRPLVPR